MSEHIFDSDEMALQNVDPNWTVEQLLSRNGVFFLKDIVGVLGFDPLKVKKEAKRSQSAGKSSWETIGVKKIWNHWIVRMTVFAPYYRKRLVSNIRKIPPGWDGNRLLEEKGLFLMTEVCKHIPFSAHQIRYRAKQSANSKQELGVWKDTDHNTFVVQMEVFSAWVKRLWSEN